MHPLQLVVNRQQLLADVIGVGKIRQRLQNILPVSYTHLTLPTKA